MADSSFDVVSKVDRQEVDNAINQAAKEVGQRFDFKNTGASIAWSGENGVEIKASTDDRVKAVLDVFKERLVKRNPDSVGARRGLGLGYSFKQSGAQAADNVASPIPEQAVGGYHCRSCNSCIAGRRVGFDVRDSGLAICTRRREDGPGGRSYGLPIR